MYALESIEADIHNLLPSEFPDVRIWFRYNHPDFEQKFHRDCPGAGDWYTEKCHTFSNVFAAIDSLANEEETFWRRYCRRGLFSQLMSQSFTYKLNMDLTLSLHYRHSWQKTKKKKHPSARTTVRLTTPRGWTINFMQSTAHSSTGWPLGHSADKVFAFKYTTTLDFAFILSDSVGGSGKKHKLLIRHEKCIERKFLMDDDVENFCYDLERNTLEGLDSCVWELGLVPFLEDKTHPCYRRPSFPSQIDEITTPTWKINLIQEHENLLRCSCRVTKKISYHPVEKGH